MDEIGATTLGSSASHRALQVSRQNGRRHASVFGACYLDAQALASGDITVCDEIPTTMQGRVAPSSRRFPTLAQEVALA
jgi:hypothetical protein